ncbi:BTB/POZ domain-containing protein [Aphelenchoides avenae]|nr:BTB/POZ domain-containing protein [Aphelenchus avenae]
MGLSSATNKQAIAGPQTDAKDTLSARIDDVSKFVNNDYITCLNAPRTPLTRISGIGWQAHFLKAFQGGRDKLICRLSGTQKVKWRCVVCVRIRIGCDETYTYSEDSLKMEWMVRREIPLISLEDLTNGERGYVRDNKTSIQVDLTVRDVYYDFTQNASAPADTKLAVGGCVFHVNKSYLSVVSPYFANLFSKSVAENGDDEVPLAGIEGDGFLKFLLTVYPTREPVNDLNVAALLRLSDFFDVPSLADECLAYLTKLTAMSFKDKLLIAEAVPHHLAYLRAHFISAAKVDELVHMAESKELNLLSKETMSRVLRKYVSCMKSSIA